MWICAFVKLQGEVTHAAKEGGVGVFFFQNFYTAPVRDVQTGQMGGWKGEGGE
jgi:hypothetical protein